MRRARRLDARAGKRRGITFSDSYGGSLPYSLAYRMAASGASASFAHARADGSSCPFCDIRRTIVSRRRHSKASPPRWSLDRPDPRDRNAGSTGTPWAKQPLGLFQAPRAEIGCQRPLGGIDIGVSRGLDEVDNGSPKRSANIGKPLLATVWRILARGPGGRKLSGGGSRCHRAP